MSIRPARRAGRVAAAAATSAAMISTVMIEPMGTHVLEAIVGEQPRHERAEREAHAHAARRPGGR